jgi:hypothetical protein
MNPDKFHSFAKCKEVRMRIEVSPQRNPLIETPQTPGKKDLPSKTATQNQSSEDTELFVPSSSSSSNTYSPASLLAAADYHAKYLAVAESNLTATRHTAAIPRSILDRVRQALSSAAR